MEIFEQNLIACRRCPRLVKWREDVAHLKRRQFLNDTYWGKPVPSFGPMHAQLLLVGLAPAAHGANRTGRMFTGDESGRWVYRALFKHGFATHESSQHRDDALQLVNTRITAIVHCAPPKNKPSPAERDACLDFLQTELSLMRNCRVIVCLGQFAWDNVFKSLLRLYPRPSVKPVFSHSAEFKIGPYYLITSYHPSQQNTFTKKLTEPMFNLIFERVKTILN